MFAWPLVVATIIAWIMLYGSPLPLPNTTPLLFTMGSLRLDSMFLWCCGGNRSPEWTSVVLRAGSLNMVHMFVVVGYPITILICARWLHVDFPIYIILDG